MVKIRTEGVLSIAIIPTWSIYDSKRAIDSIIVIVIVIEWKDFLRAFTVT